MTEIAGFWSYSHADDRAVDGAILKLASRLIDEFELLSGGEPLRLFVDREIEWGERWKERIDGHLQETTFFIPVVTPRYFRSDECRRELTHFNSAVERFGVAQLLLPIYYVPVAEIDALGSEPDDKLMALVKEIEWKDMRAIRLAEEGDSSYRTLVNELATRLLGLARETDGLPGPEVSMRHDEADSLTTATGLLDGVMRDIQRNSEAQDGLAREIETVNLMVEESLGRLQGAADPKVGFEQLDELARRLREPAETIRSHARQYVSSLMEADPKVRELLGRAESDPQSREQNRRVVEQIPNLVAGSKMVNQGFETLAGAIGPVAEIRRSLRQPVYTIQTALQNAADGQRILDDWLPPIRALYGPPL